MQTDLNIPGAIGAGLIGTLPMLKTALAAITTVYNLRRLRPGAPAGPGIALAGAVVQCTSKVKGYT
jgi:hypothetical protein